MSLVLYRKYRPQSFCEVVGQDHIVDTLRGGIVRGKISHAYLFTGPRGTGKTTVARILAKVLNCENAQKGEPCNTCVACDLIINGGAMDIIEVDAASNRGIDEIRALRDGIRFSPALLKYKVFIIDEVHMLTKESFNALLKTLEEPPAHAVFILATTEIHKVLPTILSRCQRFDFRRLKLNELTGRLKKIGISEKIKITDDALRFIALAADGSMRDAESLLGQIFALGDRRIDLADVQNILGVADIKVIFDLFDYVFGGKREEAFVTINTLVDKGIDMNHFIQDAINHLRRLVFIKVYGGVEKEKLPSDFDEWTHDQKERAVLQIQGVVIDDLVVILNIFVRALDDLRKFPLPQMALEVAVLETMQVLPVVKQEDKKVPMSPRLRGESGSRLPMFRLRRKSERRDKKTQQKNKELSPAIENLTKKPQLSKSKKHQDLNLDDIREHWDDVLKEIKPHNNSLFAFLGASLPTEFADNVLTIAAKYNFHKERLDERNNRLVIEEVLAKVFDKKLKIKCVLDENLNLTKRLENKAKDMVSSALKIFGGKVVE